MAVSLLLLEMLCNNGTWTNWNFPPYVYSMHCHRERKRFVLPGSGHSSSVLLCIHFSSPWKLVLTSSELWYVLCVTLSLGSLQKVRDKIYANSNLFECCLTVTHFKPVWICVLWVSVEYFCQIRWRHWTMYKRSLECIFKKVR